VYHKYHELFMLSPVIPVVPVILVVPPKIMQVAVLGLLGNGRLIIEKLLTSGHEVVAWDPARERIEEQRIKNAEFVVNQKLVLAHSTDELRNYLRKPRVILLALPSGEPTETALSQVRAFTEAGDVVIDAGDSNHKDTNRHSEEFARVGVRFLGVGMAGGMHALENGFSVMVGGDPDAYQFLSPVFDALSAPHGTHLFFGSGGAGHYVKMVHDGIEAGMMQVIAEGLSTIKNSEYQINVEDSVYAYQEGGVVSSYLLDLVMEAMEKDPNLANHSGNLSLPQNAKWAVDEARSKNVPAPATSQAIDFAGRSQYDRLITESFVAKLIQAMKKEVEG
jgi:6-phosphogluconate dehydrogenase